MNTISIHVSASLANTYEHANEEKKRKVEQYINAWLSAFFSNQAPDERLFDIMKQAAGIAKKNGLTPAVLNQLMK
jgi:hypothetical protein